jgi:hypothetical protein
LPTQLRGAFDVPDEFGSLRVAANQRLPACPQAVNEFVFVVYAVVTARANDAVGLTTSSFRFMDETRRSATPCRCWS